MLEAAVRGGCGFLCFLRWHGCGVVARMWVGCGAHGSSGESQGGSQGEAAWPGLVRAGPGCQGKPHTAPGPGNDAKLSGQQMTARTQASGKEFGNGRGWNGSDEAKGARRRSAAQLHGTWQWNDLYAPSLWPHLVILANFQCSSGLGTCSDVVNNFRKMSLATVTS